MKIQLCCGQDPIEWCDLNVDIEPGEGVTVVDLNELPWPWADDSVDELICNNGMEHLCPLGREQGQANIMALMRECWRVLKPGGILTMMLPSTDGRGAWQDPTHVTYWNENTFLYFLKESPVKQRYAKDAPEFTFLGGEEGQIGISTIDAENEIKYVMVRMRKPDGTEPEIQ